MISARGVSGRTVILWKAISGFSRLWMVSILYSEGPYIKYSGYLNLLEYVSNAYYRADTSKDHEDYTELRRSLDLNVRYEQKAYNEFFEKYRDSIASDVSGAVNDAYLQSQGVKEGSASYGMVVDLAVAYYKTQK